MSEIANAAAESALGSRFCNRVGNGPYTGLVTVKSRLKIIYRGIEQVLLSFIEDARMRHGISPRTPIPMLRKAETEPTARNPQVLYNVTIETIS